MASIATGGVKGGIAWLDTLKFYGQLATGSAAALRRIKYVDIGSFFHLVFGNSSTLAQILGVLAAVGTGYSVNDPLVVTLATMFPVSSVNHMRPS